MCLSDFGIKVVLHDLEWPVVILQLMKKLCLHNVNILEKFLNDQVLNKKNIAEKDDS